jgi:hypothetical protein
VGTPDFKITKRDFCLPVTRVNFPVKKLPAEYDSRVLVIGKGVCKTEGFSWLLEVEQAQRGVQKYYVTVPYLLPLR